MQKDLGKKVLQIVDAMHEEKKIGREIIFTASEAAMKLASEGHVQPEEGG